MDITTSVLHELFFQRKISSEGIIDKNGYSMDEAKLASILYQSNAEFHEYQKNLAKKPTDTRTRPDAGHYIFSRCYEKIKFEKKFNLLIEKGQFVKKMVQIHNKWRLNEDLRKLSSRPVQISMF